MADPHDNVRKARRREPNARAAPANRALLDEEFKQAQQPQNIGGILLTLYAAVGPPVVWITYFNIMYFFVQPVCRLGGEAVFHIISVIALVLIIAAGVVAWRIGQGVDMDLRSKLEGKGGWNGFIGVFGVASAALFTYAAIYVWVPVFAVDACLGFAD